MQHPCGHAGQSPQRADRVQVSYQGCGALGAQPGHPGIAGGKRQHPHAPSPGAGLQIAQHPLSDIPAAHDQQAFTAKARWQGTEGVLV